MKAASTLQGQITSCASSISQHAGVVALKESNPEEMARHVKELRAKRDLALGLLRAIPHVTCPTPQGAFYLLPDVTAYLGRVTPAGARLATTEDMCVHFLQDAKVALVPGEAFGAPGTVRLSYAATREAIQDALQKLRAWLLGLQADAS